MLLNTGKMSFHVSSNNTENEKFLFNNILQENSKEQKIIGVNNNKLNFKSHISELFRKAF